MVINGFDQSQIDALLKCLDDQFMVRLLGELSYFLGIQVRWRAKLIFLDQQSYLFDLLRSTGFDNLHPLSTLIEASLDIHSEDRIEYPSEYRRLLTIPLVDAARYWVRHE